MDYDQIGLKQNILEFRFGNEGVRNNVSDIVEAKIKIIYPPICAESKREK